LFNLVLLVDFFLVKEELDFLFKEDVEPFLFSLLSSSLISTLLISVPFLLKIKENIKFLILWLFTNILFKY